MTAKSSTAVDAVAEAWWCVPTAGIVIEAQNSPSGPRPCTSRASLKTIIRTWKCDTNRWCPVSAALTRPALHGRSPDSLHLVVHYNGVEAFPSASVLTDRGLAEISGLRFIICLAPATFVCKHVRLLRRIAINTMTIHHDGGKTEFRDREVPDPITVVVAVRCAWRRHRITSGLTWEKKCYITCGCQYVVHSGEAYTHAHTQLTSLCRSTIGTVNGPFVISGNSIKGGTDGGTLKTSNEAQFVWNDFFITAVYCDNTNTSRAASWAIRPPVLVGPPWPHPGAPEHLFGATLAMAHSGIGATPKLVASRFV